MALNGGAILQWMLGQAMLYARGLAPPNHPYLEDPYAPLNPGEAQQCSQRLVDEVTVYCDILGRLVQAYSGETMAHEARVRAHLARMEHSPYHLSRRVRQRTEDGPGDTTAAPIQQQESMESPHAGSSSSRPLVEPTATGAEGETAPGSEGIRSTARGGEPLTMFSRLNPDSTFADTLSSADGGSQGVRPPADQGGEEPLDDGETVDLQRTKKRKRGSPEPTPRPAGSTSRPPRGTPRARGRGRSTSRRPVIPKAKESDEGEEGGEADPEVANDGAEDVNAERGEPSTTLPDDEEIQRREKHYQRLRREIGFGFFLGHARPGSSSVGSSDSRGSTGPSWSLHSNHESDDGGGGPQGGAVRREHREEPAPALVQQKRPQPVAPCQKQKNPVRCRYLDQQGEVQGVTPYPERRTLLLKTMARP